ncbi:DcrB-related protein [Pseudomonas sp. NPDC089422]|uniref:DcrB-related protein n=1 Tax=Pseudomonas sp. NPDC089422 TaxID=3364466 RepID=UPI0038197DF8
MDYPLAEGTLQLPEGLQDRTVNIFVQPSSGPAHLNFNVARDDLPAEESLGAYVDRQLALIGSKLRNYTLLGKRPVSLSTAAPLAGLQVDAYYLHDGRPVYQRQAAFEVTPGRILVFSATSQSEFNAGQDACWQQLLDGFQPRAQSPQE